MLPLLRPDNGVRVFGGGRGLLLVEAVPPETSIDISKDISHVISPNLQDKILLMAHHLFLLTWLLVLVVVLE